MYLDMYKLKHGRNSEITDKFVKRWKSFDSLVRFADTTDNVSLRNKIKVCIVYIAGDLRCFHAYILVSVLARVHYQIE